MSGSSHRPGSVVLYYQHDQYGSTRLLTNQAGAVAATFSYDPYGNLTGRTGTANTPLRWNGQHQDTDTGPYYLRARYYDPANAQFLTRDPIEALTGSAYGYADNDALNAADPSGLFCLGPFCRRPPDFVTMNLSGIYPLFSVVGLGGGVNLTITRDGQVYGGPVFSGGSSVSRGLFRAAGSISTLNQLRTRLTIN